MNPPWHEQLDIFALDVGTTRVNRAGRGFGWASAPLRGDVPRSWDGDASRGNSSATVMQGLANAVIASLQAGRQVALGFECPTHVPVHDQVERLGGARSLDHARPWSASAGALVMATGMAQASWLLSRIAGNIDPAMRTASVTWGPLRDGRARVFLWEAFVSGAAKLSGGEGSGHARDAAHAVDTFRRALAVSDEAPGEVHDTTQAPVFNWLVAAAGWAGMSMVADGEDAARLPCVCVGMLRDKSVRGAGGPGASGRSRTARRPP